MNVSLLHLVMKSVTLTRVLLNFGRNSCSITCHLRMEFYRRLTYHLKAIPPSYCTNSCNNSVFFVVNRPFIIYDMKWAMCCFPCH